MLSTVLITDDRMITGDKIAEFLRTVLRRPGRLSPTRVRLDLDLLASLAVCVLVPVGHQMLKGDWVPWVTPRVLIFVLGQDARILFPLIS
jgi:hypothetical protein